MQIGGGGGLLSISERGMEGRREKFHRGTVTSQTAGVWARTLYERIVVGIIG